MLYNVSFGPVSMLALSILGCLQHSHTSVGEVSREGCIQRSFIIAARGIAPTATDAALLQSRKQGGVRLAFHLRQNHVSNVYLFAAVKVPV